MAIALVHYRFRQNSAPLDSERHYRPGDVQVVSDNPATGGGEEGEEFLVVTLPGLAAEWAHLTEPVYAAPDQIKRMRRYYFDLTKLPQAWKDRIEARKPLSDERRQRYEQLSRATRAVHLARRGARQTALDAIPVLTDRLDVLDAGLEALRGTLTLTAVQAMAAIIDRGEA